MAAAESRPRVVGSSCHSPAPSAAPSSQFTAAARSREEGFTGGRLLRPTPMTPRPSVWAKKRRCQLSRAEARKSSSSELTWAPGATR